MISIELFGPFRVVSADGTDLTPRAQKTQALIALLATGRGQRRSRAWLQDKLWSDRGQKQASGSLRQAVHDLKKALGDHASVVQADNTVVALDTEAIHVAEQPDGPLTEVEFLSGIDVRDEEFATWLQEMRAHYAAKSEAAITKRGTPSKARLCIFLVASDEGEQQALLLESVFLDSIRRTIGEFFDADFLLGLPASRPSPAVNQLHFIVRVQAMLSLTERRFVRASLESADSLRSYWSETIQVPRSLGTDMESLGTQGLAHQCIAALAGVIDHLRDLPHTPPPIQADILATTALRRMFTMKAEEVDLAERLLNQAVEIVPRGLYHAWLVQVLSIRHVERQTDDAEALKEKVNAHIHYALEAEPLNSNVLSATANARLIFGDDILTAGTLARQSVAANRDNPLAWFAWANANLYGGKFDVAYAASVTAQRLGEHTTIEFWTAFQRALTAAVSGNFHEALSYTSVSHALAPNFRPPLRYLAGIASRLGRMPDAARAVDRLRELETDFSVDRMVNDPDYPVSMMRRAGLIEPARLADLG